MLAERPEVLTESDLIVKRDPLIAEEQHLVLTKGLV